MKVLKDNLPWAAPSVAIVLAATGFFDQGGSDETSQAAPAPVAEIATAAPVVVPMAAVVEEVAAVEPVVPEATVEVTRQEALSASTPGLTVPLAVQDTAQSGALVTLQTQMAAATAPLSAVPTQPAPGASGQLSPSQNAAAFFAAAQANIDAANSCKDDLRELTQQARVYFPSGGLAADSTGIEQARLIGIVAQDCPGVQIAVAGHSDASGNPVINQRLSQQRAELVLQRIGAAGIDTKNFYAQGFGSAQPSGVRGPLGTAHYDRRVEFSVINTASVVAFSGNAGSTAGFGLPGCVNQLQRAVAGASVFYAPRSIAASSNDLDLALQLASLAQACPQARLRVVGHHSDEVGAGESVATGLLRAKAMMSMLIGRGVDAEEIIIAAPSWSDAQVGEIGSRIEFDVIYEEG